MSCGTRPGRGCPSCPTGTGRRGRAPIPVRPCLPGPATGAGTTWCSLRQPDPVPIPRPYVWPVVVPVVVSGVVTMIGSSITWPVVQLRADVDLGDQRGLRLEVGEHAGEAALLELRERRVVGERPVVGAVARADRDVAFRMELAVEAAAKRRIVGGRPRVAVPADDERAVQIQLPGGGIVTAESVREACGIEVVGPVAGRVERAAVEVVVDAAALLVEEMLEPRRGRHVLAARRRARLPR